MITTASSVASSNASTSGVGVDIRPKIRLGGPPWLARDAAGARAAHQPSSALGGRDSLQQLRVHFGLGRQPVLGFVSGSETTLLRSVIGGFGDQGGAFFRPDELRGRGGGLRLAGNRQGFPGCALARRGRGVLLARHIHCLLGSPRGLEASNYPYCQ